jgi:DNA invertase Pin-like site-specific DNA recombinase/ssDNA-binding Zn-finger/Zn-ribbon topoisomerase 1
MNTTERTGAVVYVRVSTKDQANSPHNIDNQRNACKSVCDSLQPSIVKMFIDAGESARSMDRPKFQEMLEFCRKNKFTFGHVVIQDLSRFARNAADQSEALGVLWNLGYTVHSRTEGDISNTAAGKLAANIMGSFNQHYSDSLSERMADRSRAALLNGRWPFPAPLGYINVSSVQGQPNIVPDSVTAHHVARAFELMATGNYKVPEVLRILTLEGLRSKRGNPLNRHTLWKMLCTRVYAGFVYSETVEPRQGLHVPLVSEDVFNAVQDVLSGKRKKYTPHRKVNPNFPLTGVRCTVCSSPLRGYFAKGRHGGLFGYYDCPKCRQVKSPAAKLEKEFKTMLNQLHPRPEVATEFPKVAARIWNSKQGEMDKSRRALEKQLTAQRTLQSGLVEKYIENKIAEAVYQRMAAEYDHRIAALTVQLQALDQNAASLDGFIKFAELALLDLPRIWEGATAEERVRVRKLVFGDTLACSPELQFSNPDKSTLFNVLKEFRVENHIYGCPPGTRTPISRSRICCPAIERGGSWRDCA